MLGLVWAVSSLPLGLIGFADRSQNLSDRAQSRVVSARQYQELIFIRALIQTNYEPTYKGGRRERKRAARRRRERADLRNSGQVKE